MPKAMVLPGQHHSLKGKKALNNSALKVELFRLFELRGRNQAQIIETLRQLRSDPDAAFENPPAPIEHLSVLPDLALRFWQYIAQLDLSLVVIAPPPLLLGQRRRLFSW
jgi:uncharacterized Zn finger protein